jgi:hypothetical protein
MPHINSSHVQSSSLLASLYIEALREGHSLWFRVASNSMLPLMRVEDEVYIESATARDISPGEIAAFVTSRGLVIHRIVYRQQTDETSRLLQIADHELRPGWVNEQAIVGKVVRIKHEGKLVNLQHPIANWYGRIVASIRYRLYLSKGKRLIPLFLRGCSHFTLRLGSRCIWHMCQAPVSVASV